MPPKGDAKKDDKRPPRDDKKPGDKPAAKPAGDGMASSADIFTFIFGFIFVGLVLTAVLNKLTGLMNGSYRSSEFAQDFIAFYSGFKVVSFLFSLVLIGAVVVLVRNVNRIRAEERKALYPVKVEEAPEQVLNRKWGRVIDHLESDNPSDWKLAIIEADIMLDEMLTALGYKGDSIGDKLKQVERSDFTSVEKAWEAHKIRNQIAHQGADFTMTKPEAVRVIELYKDVFEEFFVI